tara:strand:+ start:1704 stop:3440 length:1737 start_codon:yes stop_codon:yes gene_type:complete
MEAAVLLGLVAVGYLKNKKDDGDNPVITNVNSNVNMSNGENIYDSGDYYNETKKEVKDLVDNNFNSSINEGSKVINDKNLNRNLNVEGFQELIYSNNSGETIDSEDFLRNDQGITSQPYFKKAPNPIDFNDTRSLDRHQGDNRLRESKREQGQMFPLERNDNVFGNQFGEYIGDKSRYLESRVKKNELPFEQEKVSHIDTKSNINSEIKQMIADKTNIDLLRTKTNQQKTYEGRIISGKNINENRGNMGEFRKYDPDKFYENSPERYFTTTGAILKERGNPEHLLKDTYRSSLNKQELGGASANYTKGEKRSKYKKPLKIQLQNDTNRNVGADQFSGDADFSRKGYRALPNEREVTSERTYEGNLSTDVGNHTVGILDDIKGTIKETTINPANNGYMGNTTVNTTQGIQDGVRVTKKQTTIDSANNGYMSGGFNKLTMGNEDQKVTIKESTLRGYTGVAGSQGYGRDMLKDNYMNAETNPNKEVIAQGRMPTLSNTKVVNGGEHMNMEIKKIDSDYMNQSENKLSKVYSTNIDKESIELTTMKNKLEDSELMSDRIDKDLLNPFKNNPYTQSLSSFAY